MNSSVSSRLTHAFVCWLLCALWVSGAVAQPNVQGKWSTLSNTMPINPVHVALLSNGNVLVVAGSGSCPPSLSGCPSGPPYGPSNGSGALLVNPVSGQIIAQFSLSWDMFCNGMVLLADGRAFIDGGTIQYDPFYGQPQVAIFDPATNTFGNVQSMAHGRWYPTVLTLGDGSVMAFSGLDETGSGNNAGGVEFYTVGSGWSAEFFGPWIPDVYPRLHLLPSGEVFYSGAQTTSKLFDPSTITWNTNVANTNYSEVRTYGTSVLLPLTPANNYDPKVIIMGGGNPATNTTEIIDMGASTPGWQYGPNMSEARVELNAVILPNGKVLALGGSVNDEDMATLSLNADLYDPASNTFSSAGANASQRLYHSVALLVPDGTVWVAGGNPQRGTYNNTMEIYQPPYLFNADGTTAIRPSITSAPSSISYGNSFSVTTPDAANISSVVLVRNGTVTHAFGMDQREVGLSFTAGSGTLTVTAPPNGNIAPPGYYMLFLLNNSGVPSMAAFVQLMGSTGVFAPIRVNAGGPNYVDSLGQTWSADSGFNGGMTASTSNTISNTNDPTLYQTVRYGLGPSSFDYTFRVPNGNYNVVLKFAEIYWTGVGQREFNVGINGTQVLTNFDVVAAAGGAFKAIDKTFPVSATNETITVQFSPGAVDNPLVNAIQVLSASGVGVQVSPTTATLQGGQSSNFTATVTGTTNTGVTWAMSPQVGTLTGSGMTATYTAPATITTQQTVTVTATSVADPTQSATASVTLMPPAGTFTPIRVNAGGPSYVDSTGQTWSGDSGFNGGNTYATTNAISNTNDPTLYQTVRYGLGGSFAYTFMVPNGNYNVVLKFAEVYWTGTGQREFNVGINGTQVLTNFDVVAAAGGAFKAIDKTFPVSATNGTITVQFSPGAADNPLVNAIQVLSASGVGVQVSPNPLVFGNVQINTTAGPNTVTLSNIGSGTVSISTIGSPTNAAYVVSNNNCNGANLTMNTCTFQVSFTPTAAQSYPATIAINDSFGDSLTLSGAGVNSQCPGAVVVGIYTKCGQTYANAGATTISANYTPASTDNGIIVKLSWCIVSNCASSMAGVTATLTGNVSLTGFCFASPSSPFITNANGGAQGSGDFEEHYIWYCPTTPVGLTSFTGTPSSGVSSPISIDVSEWQGLSTSCPACFDVDASAVAGATQGTNASVPLTTTNANDLIYAGFEIPFNANQTGSPGSGFTAITMCTSIGCPAPAGNNPGWATEAKGVTSAGSNPANITYSIAGNWFGVAAAIKSAASLSSPTNLAATAGNGQVGLSWSASSGATSYNVKRSTTSGGPYTTIASPTTSSYTDTGVTNGTTYYYVVSAVNTAGESANSGQVSATPTAPPDFSVSVTPSSQTLGPGTGTSYTVSVSSSNGFTGTVSFSVGGLPSGTTATFNPSSILGSGSTTLSVATSSSTPTGTYTLTITGTSSTLTHSTQVTLAVADFSIAASPSGQIVKRGSKISYTVTITRSGPFAATVNFSVGGLPARTSSSFNPTSVAGSGTSTLTISVNKNATTGTYPLTITGSGGGLTHSTGVSLVIQ